MSEQKDIEFIYLQSLKKKDFESIDQTAVAALAAVSYAISEVNFLMRQYLFIDHEFSGPNELDSINYFQRNVLLRIISAKLFEASELVLLKGKYNRTSSKRLKDLLSRYQKSYRWLERHPGYELVKKLRNQATSHCTLSSARDNLAVLPDSADFSLIFHEMEGNSIYFMGETVMHYGSVLRHAEENLDSEERGYRSPYDVWMHWNLVALRWLRRVHLHLATNLILDRFPDRKAQKRMLWLPLGSSAAPKQKLTPFFVRKI